MKHCLKYFSFHLDRNQLSKKGQMSFLFSKFVKEISLKCIPTSYGPDMQIAIPRGGLIFESVGKKTTDYISMFNIHKLEC